MRRGRGGNRLRRLPARRIATALLLEDEGALSAFKRVLKKNGLELAALSAHGNPVHPDPDVAESFRQDFQNAVLLAERLGVKRIVGFSG